MKFAKSLKTILLSICLIMSSIMIYHINLSFAYGEPEDGTITEEPTDPGTQPETPPVETPEEPETPSVQPPDTTAPQSPATANPSNNSNSGNSAASTTANAENAVDTRLSELNIACGQLVPDFSPDQYSYTVYVNKNAENNSCGTTAAAMDPSPVITAEGPLTFAEEDVQKKIIVEGTDGSVSEYVINVHVLKDTELYIDGSLYTISESIDVKDLPGSFKKTVVEFKGEKVTAARSSDGNLTLLCFVNSEDSDNMLWYLVGSDEKSIYPIQIIERDGEKYIVISQAQQLLYGNHDGKIGYYLIDPDTGEMILSINNSLNGKTDETDFNSAYLIFALIGIIILCIIVFAFFSIKYKRIAKKEGPSNKYFRPYIRIDDEQTEIVGRAEEIDENKES